MSRFKSGVSALRSGLRSLRGIVANGGMLLGVCAVVLLWLPVLHSLSAEREQALQAAEQNTSNLARAFEEQIIRSIKAVDQTLLYVRDSYEKDPTGFDLAAWTRSTQAITDFSFQLALTDRSGIVTYSNLSVPGERVDLSDREHFRVSRDNPDDTLYISRPVLGRVSQKWSIQMARRLVTPDGKFDGMIVMSLDPGYLSRFYESVDLGGAGIVSLVGLDGTIRASASAATPSQEPANPETTDDAFAIGRSLSGGRLFAEYATAPSGTYIAPSRLDGITRLFSYRKVRGYPLIVVVGVSQAEILAAHEERQRLYLVLVSILSGLLLVVTGLFVVRQAQLRASEASYARSSQLLAMILENINQGVLMVDARQQVQVCNQQAIEKLGLPQALMARNPHFDEVVRWQKDNDEFGKDGAALAPDQRGYVLSGSILDQPMIYERVRPNGVVLEIRSKPLRDGGTVRTYTDITDIRRNEASLRAARDRAHDAARAKSEFLATVSHEIRSPMSGLVGVLDLLRETELTPEQSRMAGMVHNSALTLLAVLNDILDFSKIEAGALTIALEPTNVRDLVTDLAQPRMVEAARKGIAFRLEIGGDIPEHVSMDPLRLRQILGNLLSNALKFTRAGEIALRVAVDPGMPETMLRFAVRDTGIGMSKDVIGRLFTPFTQADGSTTRNFGGTGLGLCISRRLAEMLDGTLTVTSRPGEGSVFTLLLPLRQAAASDPAGLAPAALRPERLAGGGTVLVADDDFTNRWLAQRQIERMGLRVEVAENGEAALEILSAKKFDLLLTDCHMPRMDGVALTRAVRAHADPALRGLPIIGLTADATEAQRERCREAGMSEVAIKPLNAAPLSRLLARHLPKSRLATPDEGGEPEPAGRPSDTFDAKTFRELFPPGDPEGAAWLAEYNSAADGFVDALGGMLSAGPDEAVNRDAVRATAHRLAGISLSVGATRLGEESRRLEHDASSAEPAALRARIAGLRAEFALVKREISTLIDAPETLEVTP